MATFFFEKSANYKLIGIPNGNNVKTVRNYSESKDINYEFVDSKKTPPTEVEFRRWKNFMKS